MKNQPVHLASRLLPTCIAAAVLLCLIYASNVVASTYTIAADPEVTVFSSGENDYNTYRIPTITQGTNGVLYAFAEGRKDSVSDWGNIDVVMKSSADNGLTWSSLQVIQDIGDNKVSNACPVVDQTTSRINLLYCVNRASAYSTYSDDGGLTWSDSKTIDTSSLGYVSTGPVHGIQLQWGENAGRMIVTGHYSSSQYASSSDYLGSCAYYSDDGGETWQLGATDTHSFSDSVHPNENVAVELVDGSIYFNARDALGSSSATRAITSSSDGGESYDGPFTSYDGVTTTEVQNSIIRFSAERDGDATDILVYSAPIDSTSRRDMALMLSFDEGEAWSETTIIHSGAAAYSDLVKLDDTYIGALYEVGSSYDAIVFSRVAIQSMPEPSTLIMLGFGVLCLAFRYGNMCVRFFLTDKPIAT